MAEASDIISFPLKASKFDENAVPAEIGAEITY